MRINRRRGTIGPEHDPYGYTEWTITKTDETEYVWIECGLRGSVRSDEKGNVIAKNDIFGDNSSDFNDTFTKAIGASPRAIDNAYHRYQERQRHRNIRKYGFDPDDLPGYDGYYM